MPHQRGTGAENLAIPTARNLLISCVQVSAAVALLEVASEARSLPAMLAAAIGFALAGQVGFCLIHEGIHAKFAPNRAWNDAAGTSLMALFPGSFEFLRVAHLVHHRRNRTESELEDFVLPGESALLKRTQYYLLITGTFWLLVPLTSLIVALIPSRRIALERASADSPMWRKFADFLREVSPNRVRVDLLVALLFWVAAWRLLDLHVLPVALCYAAFAFSWSSQQYVYHVRTPFDIVEGALDLRLARPLELLYLHFNYHLTHHRAAGVPWLYLPAIAAGNPTQPYLRTYVELWKPPQILESLPDSAARYRDTQPEPVSTITPIIARPERTTGPLRIRDATPSDNEALLALTRSAFMASTIALRIDREPDFFALTRLRNGDSLRSCHSVAPHPTSPRSASCDQLIASPGGERRNHVLVATTGDRITGCISSATRELFVRGELVPVTYIADLKVEPGARHSIVAAALIRTLHDRLHDEGRDLLITVIGRGNGAATSLLEGRLGTPAWIRGRELIACELLAFRRSTRSRFDIAVAAANDADAIVSLLQQPDRELTPCFARDDIFNDGLVPLVARRDGRIVATVSLFDAMNIKQNVVVDAPFSIRAGVRALHVAALLTGRFTAPVIGQPLHLFYLRHLACLPGEECALRALITHARHEAATRGATFLVVAAAAGDPLLRLVHGMPRMTFRSDLWLTSLAGRADLIELAAAPPFVDFALI